MHTWKYTTRTQKFSFSVHMEISSSSEVLRMAGWEGGEFVSSRSLDQLDEGDRSQRKRCVQGQSLFPCTPELMLTGTCKQGKYFLTPWRLTFPPHTDPQSIIPGVFTQPQGQGKWRTAKVQKFCSVFQQTLFSFTPAWNLGQCKWPEPLTGIVSLKGLCRVQHVLPAASLLKSFFLENFSDLSEWKEARRSKCQC